MVSEPILFQGGESSGAATPQVQAAPVHSGRPIYVLEAEAGCGGQPSSAPRPAVRVLTCRDLWRLEIPGFRDHDADRQLAWLEVEECCECVRFEGARIQRCRRGPRLAVGRIALNLCCSCWDSSHPLTRAQLLAEVEARLGELEAA